MLSEGEQEELLGSPDPSSGDTSNSPSTSMSLNVQVLRSTSCRWHY